MLKPVIQPNTAQSIGFLSKWQPKGPWNLTAIDPKTQHIENRTFQPGDGAKEWIDKWQNRRNVYFTTNDVKSAVKRKPKKTDIARNRGAFVDIDPIPDADPIEERKRIREMLDDFPIKPTVTLFSGGGCQAFWKLKKPVHVNGNVAELEAVNIKLERLLGGDNCHNIDRIMRVPGTINIPDSKKLKKGRKRICARIIEQDWKRTYDLEEFESLPLLSERLAKWVGPLLVTGQRPGREDGPYPSRSEACLALIGEFKRARMSHDDVYDLFMDEQFDVTGHVREHKDPEKYFEREWGIVHTSDDDITRGNEDALEAVEELNEHHIQIIEEGKHRILYEGPAPNDADKISFWDVGAFRAYYAGRNILFFDGDKTKAKSAVDVWLESNLRRKAKGLIFQPNKEFPDHYNMWKGWPMKPKPGNWSLFRGHLYFNVCNGDPDLFHYFVSWWAHKFQYPEQKIGTALVMKGGEGMGKTTVAVFFRKLMGQYFKTVSTPEHVTGHFNGHLANALILHSEEAFWAGDKAAESKIKDVITSHTHMIEFKGRELRAMDSYMDMLIMGNPDWLIPASHEARRFAVYTLTTKMSSSEFKTMQQQMENGGYEGMMHDLAGWDVSDVNLQDVPKTEGLLQQKELSLEPHVRMLKDIAQNGMIPGTFQEKDMEAAIKDPRIVLVDIFYKGYVDDMKNTSHKKALPKETLGKQLKKFEIERIRRGKDKAYYYCFPSLPYFRQLFDDFMQQQIEWDSKILEWEWESDYK